MNFPFTNGIKIRRPTIEFVFIAAFDTDTLLCNMMMTQTTGFHDCPDTLTLSRNRDALEEVVRI